MPQIAFVSRCSPTCANVVWVLDWSLRMSLKQTEIISLYLKKTNVQVAFMIIFETFPKKFILNSCGPLQFIKNLIKILFSM